VLIFEKIVKIAKLNINYHKLMFYFCRSIILIMMINLTWFSMCYGSNSELVRSNSENRDLWQEFCLGIRDVCSQKRSLLVLDLIFCAQYVFSKKEKKRSSSVISSMYNWVVLQHFGVGIFGIGFRVLLSPGPGTMFSLYPFSEALGNV